MDVTVYDVVVIGAGISGLSAAYKLKKQKANLKILILEARNRVGGRTETIELKCSEDGRTAKWDVGGQWVTDTQKNITKLLAELGLETFQQDVKGRKLLEVKKKLLTYNSMIPDVSLLSLIDLKLMMSKVKRYAKKVSTLNPFENIEAAEYLDKISFESFCRPLNSTSRNIIDSAIRAVFGLGLGQMNGLFGLMY